jgi:hypothetical protein
LSLPHNIERRQTRNGTNAPYHGWDASGRFWWINPRRANGKAYAWDAICRDEAAPHLSADTLAALSAKLAATNAKARRQ